MYIIDDTYFQSPKYLIPNLEESDSKSFTDLERLIDEMCRLFLQSILTVAEYADFNTYLEDGLFPEDTTGIPQKWIDLVNGKDDWKGLIQINGTAKTSLLVDLVYHEWLVQNVSYITSFGDTKANPKGAENVNPTQRVVNTWNDFVTVYQGEIKTDFFYFNNFSYSNNESLIYKKSLIYFLENNKESYTKTDLQYYSIKNQLGI